MNPAGVRTWSPPQLTKEGRSWLIGGVEISLNALVERIDDDLFERGTRAWRLAAGLGSMGGLAPLDELTRPDVLQYLNELIASPRTDAGKRARLVLLRQYVAKTWVELAMEAHDTAIQRAKETTLTAAAKTWSLGEALGHGAQQPTREARVEVQQALDVALRDTTPWARRLDAAFPASAAVGHTLKSLVELVQGRPLAPRAEAARALLKDTEAAWLDLLGYALKRLDPQLTRRTANALDVERAADAPWLYELFRREDLMHAVTRCVTDLGFSLGAEGRLTADTESRPGRLAGAHVFELRVPGQVRLLLTAEAGFATWGEWLSAWGMALHRVHVNATLPMVERRLGDPALVAGLGRLFESFLLEEGWLKRYLRLGAAQSREASRLFAFRQLGALRASAALTLAFDLFVERGATTEVAEAYSGLMSTALGVEVRSGRAFLDLDALGSAMTSLDAFGLETALHAHLRERFNEDFYRNPATGRWLTGLAAKGQRDDAVVVAASLGGGLPLTAPKPAETPPPEPGTSPGLNSTATQAGPGLNVLAAARRRVALMGV